MPPKDVATVGQEVINCSALRFGFTDNFVWIAVDVSRRIRALRNIAEDKSTPEGQREVVEIAIILYRGMIKWVDCS